MLELRDYQRDAIDKGIYEYFCNHDGNVLIVIPTGGGKSLIIAQFLKEVYARWPDQRVLILTHVHEIIKQNYNELVELWPEAPVGINSAGLKSRDFQSPIIIGGIQSVYNHVERLPVPDLVLVDEAHLIPRSSDTMYMRLIKRLLELNPELKIIGFTATAFRLDSGMLHKGPGALFNAIGYEANVRDLITNKWLVPPRTLRAAAQIDTTGVGTRLGEFIPTQLEARAIDPETVERIANEIVAQGENRVGWLVFCCGIYHAEMMERALHARGVTTKSIFGHTKLDERRETIEAFKRQEIQCLTSMGVLTTGFNAKHVDLIALCRPTKSTGLYIQMIGRGLRLFPGKEDCLVLDFGGNIGRHGPVDAPRVRIDRNSESVGAAPVKFCPQCKSACSLGSLECLVCGFQFDPPEAKLTVKPADHDILQNREPQWLDVHDVGYRMHTKIGKPPSLKVEYRCGLSVHTEWVCLQHEGYARERAVAWWVRRAPDVPVPHTIKDALQACGALRQPIQILVRPNGRYTEIMGQKL